MRSSNSKSQISNLKFQVCVACVLAICTVARHSHAEDWTMWGRTLDRNMICLEKGIPVEWEVEKGTNIKWVAQLGSKSYGNPIINNTGTTAVAAKSSILLWR